MDKPLTLSTAYATWVRGENDNQWLAKDKDENEIGRFPAKWNERDCMLAIRFGRKFELEAFNIGIDFGKSEYKRMFDPQVVYLTEQVSALEQMNISLSEKLEKFIIGDSDGTN
jgi:hypothetical protein